jgi:hypothetical protein
MGSFFGSVHLRTTDRKAIHRTLEELATKRKARFLVGPLFDGWLAVFPDNHGQDDAVVKAIAKRFSGEMLHVLVHDDDIFAYSFFRDGKRVDHYNSRPDYFAKVSARTRQQCRGKPELLAHLLADPSALPELQELLSQGQDAPPVFATDTLERFVQLFRLRNAVSSYEYLMQGERDEIESWDQFIHVPDRSAAIAQAQQAEAALALATQQLQAAGLLLVEQAGGDLLTMALWCPDREATGFLVVWINVGNRPGPFPIERLGPPWSNPLATTGLTATKNDRGLALSPSGRYLALGGFQRTQLWDLNSNTLVVEVPCQHMVCWLGFSPDDKYLVTVSPEEIVVSVVEGGRQANAFVVPQANLAAVHASGQMVIADNLGRLSFVDYLSGKVHRTLFLGGRHVPSAMEVRLMEQGQQMDVAAMMANVRTAMEQQLKAMAKRQSKEAIEELRGEMEKKLATMQEQLAKHQQDPAVRVPPERGKEQVYQLLISGDGQWLFCTSSGGLRAYSWNDLATRDDARAIFFVEPPAQEHRTAHGTFSLPGYYYGVAHDAGANRLIYAGGTGLVHALDLASGRSAVLLDPPDRSPVHRLGLSRDCSSLCCLCAGKVVEEQGNNRAQVLQIWNYRDLAAKLD